jgi:hypothetical protein
MLFLAQYQKLLDCDGFYSCFFDLYLHRILLSGIYFKLNEFIGTIAGGILVDDAIVVLENIYRHMEMGKIGCVQRMTEQPK